MFDNVAEYFQATVASIGGFHFCNFAYFGCVRLPGFSHESLAVIGTDFGPGGPSPTSLIAAMRSVTLKVVSVNVSFWMHIHRALCPVLRSIEYPMMGDPPSTSGAFYVNTQDAFVTSDTVGADGGPGNSNWLFGEAGFESSTNRPTPTSLSVGTWNEYACPALSAMALNSTSVHDIVVDDIVMLVTSKLLSIL